MSSSRQFGMNVWKSAGPLGAAALLGVLGSCEAPPKSVAANESVHIAPTPQDEPEPMSDLARLAERDAEAFLNLRSDSAQAPAKAEQPEQPEILWNQPGPRGPAATARGPQRPSISAASESAEQILATERPPLDPVGKLEDVEPAAKQRDVLDANRLRELLIDLSKELYHEASYADMPMRELLLIAATTLVSPDRAIVPDAIPGLTERERELLGHFQSFFIQLGRKLDGSRNADDVLMEQIEALRSSLSTEPILEMGTLALCTRVGGFGDYTTFSRNVFLARSEQQAIIYVEIAGFTSELNAKGEWVTELSQQLVIYSERDGIPVWREDWQTAVDTTRNRRNDFFVIQRITLPKELSVGKYHLKVRVRDEKSRAEVEGAISFEMVADQRMTTGR